MEDLRNELPEKQSKEKRVNPPNFNKPAPKRPCRSKQTKSKLSKLLLSGFKLEGEDKLTPLAKVDKTCYYKELVFKNKQTLATSNSQPATHVIKPGVVVCFRSFGDQPFVVKAITNNRGSSALWKVVVEPLAGTFELPENLEVSHNPDAALEKTGKETSKNVMEITALINEEIEAYSDPMKYIDAKKEKLSARKKKTNKKLKEKALPPSITELEASSLDEQAGLLSDCPLVPRSTKKSDSPTILPEIAPLEKPARSQPVISMNDQAFERFLDSHHRVVQGVSDQFASALTTVQSSHEKIVSELLSTNSKQAADMKDLLNQNQIFMLKLVDTFTNHSRSPSPPARRKKR